jgi:aryl-alcohol dehydrogenase-like predicted oxidoreductase
MALDVITRTGDAMGEPVKPASLLDGVELGVGTWQWGDRRLWGYGGDYGEADVRAAWEAGLAAGIRLFDTAEIYGRGRAETLLGRFLRATDQRVLVVTKFMPRPWRLSKRSLAGALRRSLRRLGLLCVDLYLVHFPDPFISVETWMDALADAVADGRVRAVGVSNYDLSQTRRAQEALARRGVPLAAVQRQYSLLEREPERSGLLRFCHEHHIRFIAWSPIAKGVLTGKYSVERPPPGMRHTRYYPMQRLAAARPLVEALHSVGKKRGRSAVQVALNWCICKGALPIPGAKSAAQARENAGAVGWRLDADEVALLDEASVTVRDRFS